VNARHSVVLSQRQVVGNSSVLCRMSNTIAIAPGWPTIQELMTTTALLGPDPAPLTSLIAGQRRPHHPARVAGLRVKSTPLTTMPHTRPMAGETRRE